MNETSQGDKRRVLIADRAVRRARANGEAFLELDAEVFLLNEDGRLRLNHPADNQGAWTDVGEEEWPTKFSLVLLYNNDREMSWWSSQTPAVLNGRGTQIAIFCGAVLCCVEVWRYWSRSWMGCAAFVRAFPIPGAARMWITRWRILGFRRFPCFSCKVNRFCLISGGWSKATAHRIAIRYSA